MTFRTVQHSNIEIRDESLTQFESRIFLQGLLVQTMPWLYSQDPVKFSQDQNRKRREADDEKARRQEREDSFSVATSFVGIYPVKRYSGKGRVAPLLLRWASACQVAD